MRLALPVIACLVLITACGGKRDDCCGGDACPTAAVAVVHPTNGNHAAGVLRLHQQGKDAVQVVGDLEGLKPNARHAFHIHEFGDASAADGASAGSHYNPTNAPHGGPGAEHHHAGDLGNVQADANGKAHVDTVVHGVSLCGKNPILGRAFVLHEKEDDFAGQPAGNAGPRIGVGVIGVAKP